MEYHPIPNELTYIWEAFYDEGISIKQFDEDGEHTFCDIDQSRLVYFRIENKNNPADNFGLNLEDGLITRGDNEDIIHGEELAFKKHEIKLIYFRRVQRYLNSTQPAKIVNFIGWHGKVEGVYKKYMVAVTANGEYVIADNL